MKQGVKLSQYYISMSPEELEMEGIIGLRNKIARSLKDLGVGYATAFIVILYTIYTYTFLAIESEIYDSNTAAKIMEIIELVLVFWFLLEILAFLISYGFKLYFSDCINILEILVITALVIAIILDLIDANDFRVEGLFRCLRVTLVFFRIRIMILLFIERKNFSTKYNSKSSFENAYEILSSLRDRISEPHVKSNISYCINVLRTQGNSVRSKSKNLKPIKEDTLDWARKWNPKMPSFKGNTDREMIFKQVSQKDVWKYFKWNNEAQRVLEDVDSFSFDIFALKRETNGNEVIAWATHILEKTKMFEELSIDPDTFHTFISSIQQGYVDIAYHNKTHGMDVGRLAYYYYTTWDLQRIAKLSLRDLAALVIGGACHDFEHLGWNNAYLIETQHEWAVTYNDISVCENHHVAAAYDVILNKPGCNIFENWSLEDFKNTRKKITKMIIATDMALHFDYLKKFKALMEGDWDFDNEDNKTFTMSMWVHVSDLSNPTKRWEESYKWTLLVYEEFFVQGDKEKELNLPVGDLNDRKQINLAKSQIGFIDFIVQPSFETFGLLLPKLNIQIEQGKSNKVKWSSMIEQCEGVKAEGNMLMKKFLDIEDTEAEDSPRFITLDATKRTPDDNDKRA